MATSDVHGHRVPTGSDFAARKSLTDLSLSIMGGPKSVSSLSAANLYVADVTSALSVAGLPPISADNPVYVSRKDLGGTIYMNDGSWWIPLGDVDVSAGIVGTGAWTVTPTFARRNGRLVTLAANISVASSAQFGAWQEGQIGTIEAGTRPAKDTNGAPIALQPGFQANVKASGAISLQCGPTAMNFPTGSWNLRLQWVI